MHLERGNATQIDKQKTQVFRNNKCTEKTWKKVAKDITSIQSLDRLKPFVRNILKGLNDYEKDSLTQVKGEDVSFFMTETLIS